MPENPPETQPRIRSLARAASVLLAIAQSESGLTPKEISETLSISRQTTYHILHTLQEVGLVARRDRSRYVMGLRVATMAEAFGRHLAPPERLMPYIREIARRTGETAYSSGWWHGEIVIHGTARGAKPVQAAEMPQAVYTSAHARASGKLLLAFATPEVREHYLQSHPIGPCTPNTITTRAALDRELETIRRQGYATDLEEFAEGLSCLAVPIDGGMSPFVLAISAPAERFEASFDANLAVMLDVTGSLSGVAGSGGGDAPG